LVNTLKQNVEPRGADAGRQIHAEVKTGAGLDRGVLAEESAVAHQLISMHDQKCMHACSYATPPRFFVWAALTRWIALLKFCINCGFL